MKKKYFYVGWALHDRAYGGPEEGGWYYDYSEPVTEVYGVKSYHQKPRRFRSWERAYDYFFKLKNLYEEKVNKGRPSISSVLSEGIYKPTVYEGKPTWLPRKRPYYC